MFDAVLECVAWVTGLLVTYKILDRIVRLPRLKTTGIRNIVITGCDSVTYLLPAWLYIDVIIVRGGVDLVVMMSILN